ncbi:unnamed protein product [Cuscuta campestris]|uniref:Uncharacterized protein n=1 Tax=Cuscuta campestris TaxID=132261 RepID=A0A484LNC8_9ASTE|nr:unnamed protein product [Cuscuta campestris]
MKLQLFLVLSLSSLLPFPSLSENPTSDDGAEKSPVLDAGGGRLLAGVNYFVLPVTGGGLSPAKVNEKHAACPRDIVQESGEDRTGLPVVISPVEGRTGPVQLSTDVNVKFSAPIAAACLNETVWRVGKYDEAAEKFPVVTGGAEGNPGPETIGNWFKIEKHGPGYKFVFCPTVAGTLQVVCQDVGVFPGAGGARILALGDSPLVVTFKRTGPWDAPVPFLPAPLPPVPVHPHPEPPVHPAPEAPVPPAPEAPAPPAPEASSAYWGTKAGFYHVMLLGTTTFGSMLLLL